MFIIDNFIQRSQNTPDQVAVKSPNGDYTYQEISNIAQQLAAKLDEENAQDIVPFYLKDTRFVLPTVIGIWLSNRIPMPLVSALDLPEATDRVKEVQWDTLITDLPATLKQKNIIQVDLFNQNNHADFKAKPFSQKNVYILSTSGSTGIPKKVFLTESNLKWILTRLYSLINVNETTKFLFSTPYSFDVSLTELLSPVIAGAELVCLPTSPSNSESIRLIPKLINQKQITHLSLSPSFAEALLDIVGPEAFDKLKFLMVAGEAFPINLAKKLKRALNKGCKVFNLYGPTETTVYATYHQVTENEEEYVPIGRPLPEGKVKVLDANNNEAKKGELYIGGNGVTDGYLLDSVKSSSSFITLDGERYYKTGDKVEILQNGELLFLEREDDQVQVNGIRVELGEIQTLVSKIADVTTAIVKFKNKRIYIFYISSQDKEAEIKSKLPTYLNPIIIKVDHFLYTYNRKIDTQRMIDEYYNQSLTTDSSNTLDELKKLIAKYHVNEIKELDSLDSVRFIVDVENTFKIQIDDAQFSLLNTLERLAAYIDKQDTQTNTAAETREQASEADLLNLKLLFANFSSSYEDAKITASSTQQSLFSQQKPSFDLLRVSFPTINFEEIQKIRQIFTDLTTKIDLLKFAWFKDRDGKLYFKKMINPAPISLVTANSFSETDLEKVMYSKPGSPIHCLIFNMKKQELNIVFSHHALDASSSNKLKKIFVDLYQGNLKIEQIKSSSYAEFMSFVQEVNQSTDLKAALSLVPQTQEELNLTKEDGRLYITKFACPAKTTDQIYISGLYLLSQAMMKDHKMKKITGKIALNIRKFSNFDASDVIGDIHATLPWEVKENDTLTDFAKRYQMWKDHYTKGTDYRYCIFNQIGSNLEYRNALSKQWSNMNISPNYIGEVNSVKAIADDILRLPFKPNYITMVSKEGVLYCISYGRLLEKFKYQVKLNDEQVVTVTTNEY